MQIAKDTVVTINYELKDKEGKILEKSDQPVTYLHGGYDGIFPVVEDSLDGKKAGDSCEVMLEPDNAFGEYDENLVRVEPRNQFPENAEVGMQFEGAPEGSEEILIYTITDMAEDKVIVDGNHPLAGQTLVFNCTIQEVRAASGEEIDHGHVHGAHGHQH
ncbi:FKBP-type peptidyl-prolyl cis-trans isomerase [Sulfurirhabdus autotrophica]|uniref:Peptidyl-prolyl cis-trans isomerase n=1 Tax=Sulfurirhabdus autotrophica TaxID=1706046 RepID=A0A4R3YEZ7_9PROT|nr:peptidylprolyl isomerase [Sulfurirhabdus autotrophica]TCV90757.1 FKBP-type peptidyl prolyl cis-trans isomerase /apo-metallochaperone SlyD [Sulfurirhabdus autotrophica]